MTTTLEIQASATPSFVAPALSPKSAEVRIVGTLTDCPAYAWDNSDQPAILDLRERFGFQWVSDWREDLDQAAYDLIRDYLLVEWRARGYEPNFTDDTAQFEADSYHPAPTDPPNETYWAVWEAAANAIDVDELIVKANLRRYAR